jgi:putative tricarboxylic transport membrane protein
MLTDRIILVLMLVLAGAYFYATAQIPTLEIGDPLGPKAFPRLLGIALLFTAALFFVEILRERKARALEEAKPEPVKEGAVDDNKSHIKMILAVSVWTAAFFAAFEVLGYVISSVVYLTGLTAYFHRGRWKTNILTSVFFCIGTYVLFNIVLGVNLPRGVLPF